MHNTPILFIIFNRPETTKEVFGQIKKSQPRQLFIAADGPRKSQNGEDVLCFEARSVVDQIDWPCELHTLFRDENLGCKYGPLSAINWFFEYVEKGIILEDDCLPDLSFFQYCTELLERYKDNNNILSINGHNFGYKTKGEYSYSFTRYMNMWGWATWRRSAQLVEYNLNEWSKKSKIEKSWFLYSRINYPFYEIDWKWVKDWRNTFDNLITNNVDAWDYYWLYKGFEHKLYSIVPSRNLVKNIGFSELATHTSSIDHPISKLQSNSMSFPLVHPKEIKRNKDYEENFVKKVWQSYYKRNFFYQIWAFYDDLIKPFFKNEQ